MVWDMDVTDINTMEKENVRLHLVYETYVKVYL